MKQISHWAAAHVWPARILLVGGKIALLLLAGCTGLLLKAASAAPPRPLYWLLVLAVLAAVALYPARKSPAYRRLYARRKACDFTIIMCSFGMFTGLAAGTSLPPSGNEARAATIRLPNPGTLTTAKKQSRIGRWLNGAKAKTARAVQWLSGRFRELSTGWQIALIVLSVLAGVVLGVGLAGAACTIACNGAEALAVVVGILGLGGIIVGEFFLIRHIIRSGRSRD